jgi:hypothetical protein
VKINMKPSRSDESVSRRLIISRETGCAHNLRSVEAKRFPILRIGQTASTKQADRLTTKNQEYQVV